MSNELVIAITAGLTTMLGWGFADFFAKKTIDKVGDLVTLAWAHIYGVTLVCSLVLARSLVESQPVVLPVGAGEWMGLVFFGALQAFVYYFAYKAFGKGKLAVLNPIFSSYSGIVVLLSVLVFKETLLNYQLFALAAVFLGIIIMNVDHDSFKLRKLSIAKLPGMKEIVAALLMAAVWTIFWGHFVSGKDWLVYAAIMYIFMSLTILIICLVQKAKLNVLNEYTWKFFFLIGLSEVLAYVAISYGFGLSSHTSIVAVLSAAFSLPTFVLSYVFLKERVNAFQLIGALFVVLGVVFVSFV